jgi:hypothetical protein
MSNPETYLMKGPMPELSKMKMVDIKEECKMWRNLWGWIPPEVKYYVSRIGQDVRLVLRNYKGNLGTLIDTHWDLVSLEVGTIDKIYDSVDDKYYWEKKIMNVSTNAILLIEWIKERKSMEAFEEETQKAKEAAAESETKELDANASSETETHQLDS